MSAAALLVAALAAFGGARGRQDSLLPPPPAGWRTERLEFPLSFAPELEYEGFEDLAFAPGMFTPGSDSYFTYALALRLQGDVELDETALARFLETYYRGLCRAVAAERGLERDANAVRAHVGGAGGRFAATIEMFDPFTTGDELVLALELDVHAVPRATEVLALVSHVDADAPIWAELHALRDAWRAARPAPVFLNHFYAVVDAETYAALAGSSFLRETFAVSEERTTVRADRTYTGLYFYGQRTYFEFLQSGADAGTGLALGVERDGALADLARRLGEHDVPTQSGPITRRLGDEELPWFEILGVEMSSDALTVFAMEYDERFLARWHAGKPPADGGITRAAVLARYAAALGRDAFRPTAPFLDVTRVELALDEPERARVLAVGRAAGWELQEEGDTTTCHGPQLSLVLVPFQEAARSPGVTRFEVALRTPLSREPLQLGKVGVEFEDRAATFSLDP